MLLLSEWSGSNSPKSGWCCLFDSIAISPSAHIRWTWPLTENNCARTLHAIPWHFTSCFSLLLRMISFPRADGGRHSRSKGQVCDASNQGSLRSPAHPSRRHGVSRKTFRFTLALICTLSSDIQPYWVFQEHLHILFICLLMCHYREYFSWATFGASCYFVESLWKTESRSLLMYIFPTKKLQLRQASDLSKIIQLTSGRSNLFICSNNYNHGHCNNSGQATSAQQDALF